MNLTKMLDIISSEKHLGVLTEDELKFDLHTPDKNEKSELNASCRQNLIPPCIHVVRIEIEKHRPTNLKLEKREREREREQESMKCTRYLTESMTKE